MIGIRSTLRRVVRKLLPSWRLPRAARRELTMAELKALRLGTNLQYLHFVHVFDRHLSRRLREHRAYFCAEGRGFGEDAFHAMWHLLLRTYRPKNCLEIGVFRGQTVSLWRLIAAEEGVPCEIGCISPFSASGDAVSQYSDRVDYYEDMIKNHAHFGLPLPTVCRDFSTGNEARLFVEGRRWDLVYIDGNHDYEVARSDWNLCVRNLSADGIVVLDDSALGTDYNPPFFATAGHPGPSRLAAEVLQEGFTEVLAVGHNRVFCRIKETRPT